MPNKKNLVPIRIRFNKKPDGSANYPIANDAIPVEFRVDENGKPLLDAKGKPLGGMAYIDAMGIASGLYDKVNHLGGGHSHGTMCAAVPAAFAEKAAQMFPRSANPNYCVEIINEAEFASFIDERAHIKMQAFRRDFRALQELKAERDLRVALGKSTVEIDAEIEKALDPDDPAPGVERIKGKGFAAIKATHGATFDSSKADFVPHPVE